MQQQRIRTSIGEQNGIVMCQPFQGEWKVECRFMRLHVGQLEWATLQGLDERFAPQVKRHARERVPSLGVTC